MMSSSLGMGAFHGRRVMCSARVALGIDDMPLMRPHIRATGLIRCSQAITAW